MDTLVASNLPAGSSNMDLRAYCDHASKMRESSDIAQIAAALVRAQAALANPPRNRSVQVRTKAGSIYTFRYATLDKIRETIREPLGGNGLCVLQPIVSTQRGPVLVTRLLHESGQWMECEIPLPTLGDSLQDFGSAITYVRRYAVSAMLNITADEDDDGNTAEGNHVADAPHRDNGRRGPVRPVPDNGRAGTKAGAGGQEPAPRQGRAASGNEDPNSTAGAPINRAQRNGEGAPSPASPRQPDDAAAARTAKPRQASDTPRRSKDEAAPPSAWGILRPGKAAITAPDGTAWLKWWTGIAGKAAAGGKRDELRALYEANTAGWDQIALGSAEGQDVVAKAAEIVRAALDG